MRYLKALGILIAWWLSIGVVGSVLLALVGFDERIASVLGFGWGVYSAFNYLKQKSQK